ncbi:MAG: DUF2726 domain-containing protein [Sulfuritalea sp.]|nr:DUF2726 domain-containing protein [Sulfuritalea sp.]
MKSIFGLIAFGFCVLVVIGILKRMQQDRSAAPWRHAFYGKKPLSEAEQVLYFRLKEAMPECIVLAQVALPALVGIESGRDYRAAFNRIASKYVDFVVCLTDFTVVAVVELDDKSHARPDRVRADTTKDNALRLAGHPILRFKVHRMPTVEQLRAAIRA